MKLDDLKKDLYLSFNVKIYYRWNGYALLVFVYLMSFHNGLKIVFMILKYFTEETTKLWENMGEIIMI